MMRHPPSHPCTPRPSEFQGVLLPRILLRERCRLPRFCTELCIESLPACACRPLCLRSLWSGGAPPTWTAQPDLCGRVRLHVTLPLIAHLCDACGAAHAAASCTELEMTLPCGMEQLSRGTLFLVPCMQLPCAQEGRREGLFSVELCITLDAYLLQFEPFYMRPPKPACPDLPLYPPPPGCSC